MNILRFLSAGVTGFLVLVSLSWAGDPATKRVEGLSLEKGDRICLVGNALGERMQHHNYWETMLHADYPQLNLAVRNLCFPGDEPLERIRSKNFGAPASHLTHSKASVVLYFFGLNESFKGKAGLKKFEKDLLKRLYPSYPSTRQLAKKLGLSHTAIANKLREYGINKATVKL